MTDQERAGVRQQGVPRVSPVNIRSRPEQQSLARKNVRPPGPRGEDIPPEVGELKGVYIISVASRLLEMHPQTLRKYERLGLVRPSRTIGMLRLYSEDDIEKLRLIRHLEENLGLNLAGVVFTLTLLSDLLELVQRLSQMQEAEQFIGIVEQEMSQLFERLNLPLQASGSAK